jgi:CubicO group peptidase (beta-lactamase class C family)
VSCVLLAGAVACSSGGPGPSPGPAPASRTTASADGFTWQTVAPARAGLDAGELRRIARDARRTGTTCLLVVRDGRIAAERYWHGGSADEPVAAFSVTKSVTSTLVGIAQGEGELDLDDRAARYVPAWRGTPAAAVRVRNLLANDSGRAWSEESDYQRLILAPDRTSYAVRLPQVDRPGVVWNYNNAAVQTLDAVLSEATGTDTATFADERLFGPLGMADTRMTADASGRSTSTAFGLETTCRDLARFGLLFLAQGRWEGERLLPAGWVREATGQPSQRLNPSYGLLWWVNGDGGLVPGGPRTLYAALGFGGQVLLVDPASKTLVVRLGTPGAEFDVVDAGRVLSQATDGR